MASEVGICNDALNMIGEDAIISLTENSKAAGLCNQFYASTRDALLRSHPWNFATKRIALAKLTSTPVFGFANEYQLPSDFLKVQRMDDNGFTFKIEGGKLLTDEDPAKIIYTMRVTNPNMFDVLFIEVLSIRLAWLMAQPLADSLKLSQEMKANFNLKISEARTMDAMEGTPENIEATEWLSSRL